MRRVTMWLAVMLAVAATESYGAASVIDSVRYEVDTGDVSTLQVHVFLDIDRDVEEVSPTFWMASGFDEAFDIRTVGTDVILASGSISRRNGPDFLVFEVEGLTKPQMSRLVGGVYYIAIAADLRVPIDRQSGGSSRTLTLTAADLEQKSRNVQVTRRQRELFEQRGTALVYANRFDVGKVSDQPDSVAAVYAATFDLRAPVAGLGVWTVNGRISTKKNDPAGRLAIYPLNRRWGDWSGSMPMQAFAQVGVEGNQDLSQARASGRAALEMLVPNLVDLSYGMNRMRLKPLVRVGAKVTRGEQAPGGDSDEQEGQVFADLHYYVPILDRYSLTIDLSTFATEADREFNYRLDALLGLEVPGTGLKAIAKFSRGRNDVSFTKDSTLMLGLAMDLMGEEGARQVGALLETMK